MPNLVELFNKLNDAMPSNSLMEALAFAEAVRDLTGPDYDAFLDLLGKIDRGIIPVTAAELLSDKVEPGYVVTFDRSSTSLNVDTLDIPPQPTSGMYSTNEELWLTGHIANHIEDFAPYATFAVQIADDLTRGIVASGSFRTPTFTITKSKGV